MKHFNLSILLIFLACSLSWAQSKYYYSEGEKIYVSEDYSAVVVQFKENVLPSEELLVSKANAYEEIRLDDEHFRLMLDFDEDQKPNTSTIMSQLSIDANQVESISFALKLDGGFRFYPTNHVVLELLDGEGLSSLNTILTQYNARYLRTEYETVVLEINDLNQVLDLSNAIYESGTVKWAHPDFFAPVKHFDNPLEDPETWEKLFTPSDPLFGQQFQMNNTGQTLDGFPGTNDMDCNAPEAWDITTGSNTITVAVIDDGVEAHEDLGTVLTGYAPLGGSGQPLSDGAHGQACAGIIAALHNGIGVAGLAPNVRILPVNIFKGNESTQDLANAIRWAVDNGADVLSNSWGYPNSCGAQADNINSALAYANSNGRGGRGAIVTFSSGNDGLSCVNYPAWRPEVIAVGAFGNDGIISEYSNQGSDLDIVAPSNDVRSSFFGNTLVGAGVRTIDREGSAGYDPGNYTTGFGGTSASCPVVSGVAALVLSVNPNLSHIEVKNILYNTANDMGSGGFDNVYGFGRVDAFAAVQAAGGNPGGGNNAPSASFTSNVTSGNAPLTVSFDASGSSDPDGDGLSYSWNFGDGNSGTGVTSSHTYTSAGTFTAILTVSDGDLTAQSSVDIVVGSGSGGGTDVLATGFFETGLDGWVDGGSDCVRFNNSTRAAEGSYSMRIRDNTNSSTLTSPVLDLAGYNSVSLEFSFYPRGMENGEDFWIQYNSGSGWTTLATVVVGQQGIVNNQVYTATFDVNSNQIPFVNGALLRFRNDASVNNDQIYLDAITITASASINSLSLTPQLSTVAVGLNQGISNNFASQENSLEDISIYPNPVNSTLYMDNVPDDATIELFTTQGKRVARFQGEDEMDMESLPKGMYIMRITARGVSRMIKMMKE